MVNEIYSVGKYGKKINLTFKRHIVTSQHDFVLLKKNCIYKHLGADFNIFNTNEHKKQTELKFQ